MKRKTKPKFKVSYAYVPSPDAAVRRRLLRRSGYEGRERLCRRHEERVNRAYDMLFDKIDPFDYCDYAQYSGSILSVTEVLRKLHIIWVIDNYLPILYNNNEVREGL